MNILGATNHLLVGCMVHSTRQNSRMALLTGPGICGWGGRVPRRELAALIVLNGHHIQLFPKYFPLSPQDRMTTFISRAFCSRCQPTQRHEAGDGAEDMRLEGSALSGTSVLYPLPSRLKDHHGGSAQKDRWEAVQGSCETLLSECDKAVTGTTSQWV